VIFFLEGDGGVDCVQANVSNDESAAWPVANPVVTCASVSDAGYPSNFVADPFLFIQVIIEIIIIIMMMMMMIIIIIDNRFLLSPLVPSSIMYLSGASDSVK